MCSGIFIPSCDEDGYYRKLQCDQSSGDCWCVDQLGLELTGTRTHGSPDCGKGGNMGPPTPHLQLGGLTGGRAALCHRTPGRRLAGP